MTATPVPMTALLDFKNSLDDFEVNAKVGTGEWVAGGKDPCDWTYVLCSNDVVAGLNFSGVPLQGGHGSPVNW